MKNSYSKFIALGSLVFLTATYSCKKLLDKQPSGALLPTVLANKAGVDGLLIGAYSMLDGYTQQNGGTSWESGIDNWTYGGLASDDAFKGSNTTDQGPAAPLENHSVDQSADYVNQKWVAVYNGIQRANDVIREIPLVTDGSVSTAYAAEVIGEARFLRGIYHLEAAKMWRNAPYVDETITYTAGNYQVGNPGPIWDKIEADFTAAMAALPKTQPQVGRATYYAAEALLAKTLITDHKYSTALPMLTDLIDNGTTANGTHYNINGAYEDNYNASTKNGPESVFAVQMTANDGSNGYNGNEGEVLNFPAGTYTGCCGFYQPSYTLANAFKVDAAGLPMLGTTPTSVASYNADQTTKTTSTVTLPNYNITNLGHDHGYSLSKTGKYTLGGVDTGTPFVAPTDALDPRIDWTVGRRDIPYLDWGLCGGEAWSRGDLNPYNPIKNVFWHAAQAATAGNGQGWAQNQDVANNYNIVRLADLYLWRAECYIDANNLPAALADVNKVRGRMVDHHEYWVHKYLDNSNPGGGFAAGDTNLAANYKIARYVSFPSKAYALAAVIMEEQLEFGMEGHRFFDLQRQDALYGGPAGASYMANVLNAHTKADTRINNPVLNGAVFTAGKNELWPIPLQQFDIEAGKLKQNPGY
ncbi:RagB/SusD family nutrient uptake outer membrane protein [Mucilaginibacter sp. McL0603]|uniref:RagB/SusD family nutrient uptake outer membrane protein n=1 Tax=Mucilaginibacter sp. McL0603 TaxID=3415670 RepID=UPI003CFB7A23